ncbi:hypothetical protein Lepto7376_1144 [[Leptolyngbya] sp. PCC 7376]|uniref:hypothetical protein n=1 Tax=[Leptolyngbya] sp. PCC 7376 TaxID=111781 RepID=UPI00029F158C|nr:hypothetical protein [[Leptolyngbya] sp. PCC 7376]AFY37507.1 hypothetical protein Lepto7376_1144 [[Leptolyngbya] sp. PCC 7376]
MSEPTHLPTSSSSSSKPVLASDEPKQRNHPIPPASHPRQYRAIGIVRGKYTPDEADQLSKGNITTTDGDIEAVLLGRVISLVKNHIDLEQEHVWVVYPRTRQDDNHLHLQILGVWEPENLDEEVDPATDENVPSSEEVEDGYFSIRGQVIFYDAESKKVIVKIRQAPKKDGERPKFFKVQLYGALPERPVNHFYDLTAKLIDNVLNIQTCEDIGLISPRRKKFGGGGRRSNSNSKFKGKPQLSGEKKGSPARDRPVPRPKPKTES